MENRSAAAIAREVALDEGKIFAKSLAATSMGGRPALQVRQTLAESEVMTLDETGVECLRIFRL
jgi:hypothetical protein